jgi:hypothetical protein
MVGKCGDTIGGSSSWCWLLFGASLYFMSLFILRGNVLAWCNKLCKEWANPVSVAGLWGTGKVPGVKAYLLWLPLSFEFCSLMIFYFWGQRQFP